MLPIGYADGLNRRLSGKVQFLLRGKAVPQVGRICMDMCMVDLSSVPDAQVGDEVTVIGAEGCVSCEAMSEQLDTIPYEITCQIGRRVPRINLSED